ncbi:MULTISPECIES: hypothetical protein [Streptomyces]|uniref:Uncharacterized protein n=2 Tax=Streptomyces TaxID=1883 RepID=A0A6A0B1D0_9ACTN|nr:MULTISPECIES: hypothetical protein [Streptomyces]AWK11702.1 hypothetical protein DDQ41_25455 [Streptomyces spongiicola]GFH38495.1 hypothetical protein SCWH03_47370 [Streptomyces pacificus]
MEPTAADISELTWICDDLPQLRTWAAKKEWAVDLDRAVDELRNGTRTAAAVAEEVRRRLGWPVRRRGYEPAPGQAPAPPPAGFYTCPGRRCSRWKHRAPGGPLPECALFGEPMSFG